MFGLIPRLTVTLCPCLRGCINATDSAATRIDNTSVALIPTVLALMLTVLYRILNSAATGTDIIRAARVPVPFDWDSKPS
jgi:hypothetical protein